jgi:radical SAM protein with 4Fe4S-binding SPASM domain
MGSSSHFIELINRSSEACIPLEVALELTHHCNFRCSHCYIPDFQAPDLLTTDRIMGLLDELVDLGTLFLTLTGGEFLLRKDWIDIARRARRLGFSLTLLTNGALIDEEVADQFAEVQAAVGISFYANDREVFESITRKRGSFDATLRGIELVKDRGLTLELTTPVMTLNRDSYRGAIEFAESIGATGNSFSKILSKKDGSPEPIALRMSGDTLTEYLLSNPQVACAVLPTDGPMKSGPLCAAGVRYATISSSGDVLACNIMPVIAGNILETPFREIWENAAWFKKLRGITRADLETCSTCEKYAYCGRCPAQALVEDGNILGPSGDACAQAAAKEKAWKRGA